MRCLVVGGSGQDGTLLSAQLLAEGHRVVSLSRKESRLSAVTNVFLDIRKADAVDEIVREFRPEQVYYLAAFHRSSEDPAPQLAIDVSTCLAVNTIAFGDLLGSIERHVPTAKTVYASSSRVFGACDGALVQENTARTPVCAYGISKAAGMDLAGLYRRTSGLFVSSAILFNHESELRPPSFVTTKLAAAALVSVIKPTTQVKVRCIDDMVDWGSARDYTAAMRYLLDQPESGDYVVASGYLKSVAELAAACFAYVGRDWREHVTSAFDRQSAVRSPRGDAHKIRSAGWEPFFTFEEMVEDLMHRLSKSMRNEMSPSTDYRDFL
jgi:GDPmannose 4,6-dehydratase